MADDNNKPYTLEDAQDTCLIRGRDDGQWRPGWEESCKRVDALVHDEGLKKINEFLAKRVAPPAPTAWWFNYPTTSFGLLKFDPPHDFSAAYSCANGDLHVVPLAKNSVMLDCPGDRKP
jgi:hypothetical protein